MRLVDFVNRARSLAVYVDDVGSENPNSPRPCYRLINITMAKQTLLKLDVDEAANLRDALDKALEMPEEVVKDG